MASKKQRGAQSKKARALARKYPTMSLQLIADRCGMRRQSVVDALKTKEGVKARPPKKRAAKRKAAKR